MLALLLVCFSFVIVFLLFCFLVLLSHNKKKQCFPCNSSFFWVMVVNSSLFSMLYDWFLFFFLVLFVCNLSNEIVLLFLCCPPSFFITRLSGFFFEPYGIVSFLCGFVLILCFFIPLNKRPPTTDRAKTKKKMQKRGTIVFQLALLCSQIVFLILGVGQNAILLNTL